MNNAARVILLFASVCAIFAQPPGGEYRAALPNHRGQVSWTAPGFRTTENSAKPTGSEIGFRGQDASGRITFLTFLFLYPEVAPMTSVGCREAILAEARKANPAIKPGPLSELPRSNGLPVAVATYSAAGKTSTTYSVRGFIAKGDLCADMEVYSSAPIAPEDPVVKALFGRYQLDPDYPPGFVDLFTYGQILFQKRSFAAAATWLEKAIDMVPNDGAPFPSAKVARHIVRDQAGMAHGIAGNLASSRRIFEAGIREDADYPMYYYNLACADAGDKNLKSAMENLQKAFDRRANVNPGESMPPVTQDDSFTPYRNNKEFWAFLQKLEALR